MGHACLIILVLPTPYSLLPTPYSLLPSSSNPQLHPRRLRHPRQITHRNHPNLLPLHSLYPKPIPLLRLVLQIRHCPKRLHHRRQLQPRTLDALHPFAKLRSRVSQTLGPLDIPLQRNRLEHPNHPVRPVPAIDLHRITSPRIERSRNPLPHQPPHSRPLKLRPHSPCNRRPPSPLAFLLHLQRLHIHPHQLLQLRRHTLGKRSPSLGNLHRIGERIFQHLHHRLRIPRPHPQPGCDLTLQPLQQTDVRIGIHAPDPAPVPRKTHHRAIELVCSGAHLPQHNPDIRKLALHHIRHIPDQEELALDTLTQPSTSDQI